MELARSEITKEEEDKEADVNVNVNMNLKASPITTAATNSNSRHSTAIYQMLERIENKVIYLH